MKSLRRSLNSDKSGSSSSPYSTALPSPPLSSLPLSSRPGQAILPPQKVIRAITSYKSDVPLMLSYAKGDFFYVNGELPGDERCPGGWYEALNPLSGTRGRVAKSGFEEFTKGGRTTTASNGSSSSNRPISPATSQAKSYSSDSTLVKDPMLPPLKDNYSPGAGSGMGGSMQPPAGGERKPAPLYAIVQYDFEAERPDELDAKAGEPIIVIAQSNHEWFVAKPIGRLGGPGLIPVAFVEIRDPVTSQPVKNVAELLSRGGIPQVEEWKKKTAEYKAASIPLGRFDFADASGQSAGVKDSPYGQQQGGENGGRESRATQNSGGGGGYSGSNGTGTTFQSPDPRSSQGGGHAQVQQPEAALPILSGGEIISTHVSSFHYESNAYWFRINAIFLPDLPSSSARPGSAMSNAPYSRTKATNLVLYRLYEDFYNFQITLLDLFPREAGRTASADGARQSSGGQRILPYMPGPLENVDTEITNARREDLDTYLKELMNLGNVGAGYILRHEHVLGFFTPGAGDQSTEIDREEAMRIAEATMVNIGGGGERDVEEQLADLDVGGRPGESRYSREVREQEEGFFGNANGNGRGSGGRPPSSSKSSGGDKEKDRASPISASNSRGPSPYGAGGVGQRPESGGKRGSGNAMFSPALTTGTSTGSWGNSPRTANPAAPGNQSTLRAPSRTSNPNSAGLAAAAPPFMKIKILDRTTDDMIAIRVPPRVTYSQLMEKVQDRLGGDVRVLKYRLPGGGGNMYAVLEGDAGLEKWLRTEDKLVLYAESAPRS